MTRINTEPLVYQPAFLFTENNRNLETKKGWRFRQPFLVTIFKQFLLQH